MLQMLSAEVWRPTITRSPVSAIKQRVPDPFERLFLQEYPKVVAIAYRVLANRPAAEDVAQEVFLKFHRSLSPDSERASGWLHAAAVHSALNVVRGERRRAQRESIHAREDAEGSIANPERLVEEAERRREVRQALTRLPERTAAVLLLRHSGLSYAEVATALRMKVGNVGTVLRRAEAALRKEVNRAASE
jgi:RNA polymerase sigma-70 factor (ECF subfamily)